MDSKSAGQSSQGPLSLWPSILGGLLAALVFLAVWLPTHPAEPLMTTADLYTPLSVARHLVQGDGFKTDIAYPLSFAFPFAQELPQPLVHRGPGFSLVLVLPYLAAGQDPDVTITAVRWLQIGLLGLMVLTGTVALLRRGLAISVVPWLLLLGSNSLLVFSVNWGFEELLAGWLLLLLWLRVRDGKEPALMDGFLAGLLALLRVELFWVPVLWWIWFHLEKKAMARRDKSMGKPLLPTWSRIVLAVVVMVLLQAPWAIRNVRLTGQPFFSLQSQAELVKDTSTWPLYSVYKQMTPQPLGTALKGDPDPIVRKIARGLKFYATSTQRLLAWPYLILGLLLVFVLARGKVTDAPCPFRKDRDYPMTILPDDSPRGPYAAGFLTMMLLAAEYSFFDHSLRHLLVLLPVLIWEISPLTGDLAADLVSRKLPECRGVKRVARDGIISGLLTLAVIALTTSAPEGWLQAQQQARQQNKALAQRVTRFQASPINEIFVDESALTWYADRAAVWDPQSEPVREEIRQKLR